MEVTLGALTTTVLAAGAVKVVHVEVALAASHLPGVEVLLQDYRGRGVHTQHKRGVNKH